MNNGQIRDLCVRLLNAESEDEVVELASELIRIDTTNTGDPDTVTGEREAAEYVAAKLTEAAATRRARRRHSSASPPHTRAAPSDA